jgi:hypothetical protein
MCVVIRRLTRLVVTAETEHMPRHRGRHHGAMADHRFSPARMIFPHAMPQHVQPPSDSRLHQHMAAKYALPFRRPQIPPPPQPISARTPRQTAIHSSVGPTPTPQPLLQQQWQPQQPQHQQQQQQQQQQQSQQPPSAGPASGAQRTQGGARVAAAWTGPASATAAANATRVAPPLPSAPPLSPQARLPPDTAATASNPMVPAPFGLAPIAAIRTAVPANPMSTAVTAPAQTPLGPATNTSATPLPLGPVSRLQALRSRRSAPHFPPPVQRSVAQPAAHSVQSGQLGTRPSAAPHPTLLPASAATAATAAPSAPIAKAPATAAPSAPIATANPAQPVSHPISQSSSHKISQLGVQAPAQRNGPLTPSCRGGASAAVKVQVPARDEKAALTPSGELIGGFEDFRPGNSVIVLPLPPSLAALAFPAASTPLNSANPVSAASATETANANAISAISPAMTASAGSGAAAPGAGLSRGRFVLLEDWRPLVEMVPLWRHFLKQRPDLTTLFLLDTGGGGDCLFHAVASGINHLYGSLVFVMEQMRDVAARQLERMSEAEVVEFVIDLVGHMPDAMKALPHAERVRRLQATVRASGSQYWGETGTLRQLLLKAPPFADNHIGFAVLNVRSKPVAFRPLTDLEKSNYERRGIKPPRETASRWEPRVETSILRLPSTRYLMFLHCLHNTHWVLLGYAPKANSPEGATEARIGTTFPITGYPDPLFPFIQEQP